MKQQLFQNFSPASKQDWAEQAKKDLKGADFDSLLVSAAPEGFRIQPYYAVEDTASTQWIKTFDNQINPPQQAAGLPARHWTNAVEITGDDEAAINREILWVLNQGADGLILPLSEPWDWDIVLSGVVLPSVSIWIKPSAKDPLPVLEGFFSWLDQAAVTESDLRGGVMWDGLHFGLDQPIAIEEQIDQAASIHRLFGAYNHFRTICVDSSVYADAGATAAQELGYGLAALVELWDGLTEKDIKAEAHFADLFVMTAVGSDYFMEIAKLKTLRIMLHQLAKQYQVDLPAETIHLFVKTSQWTKSKAEPHNNFLRNTTEAMSAIIGGCNSLYVLPHDSSNSAFAKRMARNIPTILREEGYFDKTIDPAAGSYYLENLIQLLLEESWNLLARTESQGGWWQLYLEHRIQQDVKATRSLKFQQLIQGRSEKVGLTKPVSNDSKTASHPEAEHQLKPSSQFLPFERAL